MLYFERISDKVVNISFRRVSKSIIQTLILSSSITILSTFRGTQNVKRASEKETSTWIYTRKMNSLI
jgi:hypothetical protein